MSRYQVLSVNFRGFDLKKQVIYIVEKVQVGFIGKIIRFISCVRALKEV